MDTANPARGRKHALVILHEATVVRDHEAVWTEAARPTLTDLGCSALFLGTPKGGNAFHRLSRRGRPASRNGPPGSSPRWTIPTWTRPRSRAPGEPMALFDRWQEPWETTETRVIGYVAKARALIDSAGAVDPIVERLQKGPNNIEGFKFTALSRQQLMEGQRRGYAALQGTTTACVRWPWPCGYTRKEFAEWCGPPR